MTRISAEKAGRYLWLSNSAQSPAPRGQAIEVFLPFASFRVIRVEKRVLARPCEDTVQGVTRRRGTASFCRGIPPSARRHEPLDRRSRGRSRAPPARNSRSKAQPRHSEDRRHLGCLRPDLPV